MRLFILLFCITYQIFAQIGIGTVNPNSSAIIDITSTNKGFLLPRMTKVEANKIKTPSEGLLVYCTNCCNTGYLYLYSDQKWNTINPCFVDENDKPSIIAGFKFETPNPHSYVIGQPDFVSGTIHPTSDTTFVFPTAIQITVDGKVFIVDSGNNRVLMYQSFNAFLFNFPADLVIGQTDFVTGSTSSSSNKMESPTSLIIDNQGTLWVTDRYKDRVLGYNNSSSLSGNNPTPDYVIGANSTLHFDTVGLADSQKLRQPQDLALDKDGNIWIGSNDGRILHYNRSTLPFFGAHADKVLGRSSFEILNFTQSPTASQMVWSSAGLLAHSNGDLFVSDYFGNRVLLFKDAGSKNNGDPADFVYFQNDFTSNIQGVSNSNINGAGGLSLDILGNLYISDYENNRVLIIENIENKPSSSPANYQIGQVDFNSNVSTTTQTGLSNPFIIKNIEHKGQSLVSISDVSNNRIVIFGGSKMELFENTTENFTLKTSSTATDTTLIYSIIQQPSLGIITLLEQETGYVSIDLSGINVNSPTIEEFIFEVEDINGVTKTITQPFLIKNN